MSDLSLQGAMRLEAFARAGPSSALGLELVTAFGGYQTIDLFSDSQVLYFFSLMSPEIRWFSCKWHGSCNLFMFVEIDLAKER
jgi:hypothetical protein